MKFRALVYAAVLLTVPALAASPLPEGHGATPGASRSANPPLKPGRSAGVLRAQMVRGGLALVGAGGVIAAIAVVAASGGGNSAGGQMNPQSVAVTTTR
ncbi:MAG TPA: hypothetical protein VHC40_00225 [Rhizomicrobium sp.]|nr:hypothetical protein [Rhizomicrobium sp.]